MDKTYSVWRMPYNKRYLLTHPWQWFHCAWRCLRDAWRRSVYGWTYSDTWDWDSWFLHTTPNMLRHIADYGCAYPGHEPFTTPEKWHEWLHEIADLLETGLESWQDEHNEYYEEYCNQLMNKWKPFKTDENGWVKWPSQERTELEEKYLARDNELRLQGEANIRRAMTTLGEHFSDLWD